MNDLQYHTVNLAERPDLIETADQICGKAWPEFMLHDTIVNKYWWRLYENFAQFQFALLEKKSEKILAVGNSVPARWSSPPEELPDNGLDWILAEAFEPASKTNLEPLSLFALQVVVNPAFQGYALSTKAIQAMIGIARQNGCNALYAPVRPNHKHLYPLAPMNEYVGWKDDNGRPFDPWMRVHSKLGAETIKVCPESMRIPGTIADWEKWTGMHFPSSGEYIIPGALAPVIMDIEADLGLYIEPNVWMHHKVG